MKQKLPLGQFSILSLGRFVRFHLYKKLKYAHSKKDSCVLSRKKLDNPSLFPLTFIDNESNIYIRIDVDLET